MSDQKVKRSRRPSCGSVYAVATIAGHLRDLLAVVRGKSAPVIRCRKATGHLGPHEWWSATARKRWE